MLARIFKTITALCAAAFLLTGCDDGYDPQLEAPTEGREVRLSFHLMHHENDNPQVIRIAIEKNLMPPGTRLVPYHGVGNERYLLIFGRTRIDQDCISSTNARLTPVTNLPVLNFKFDEQCTAMFGKWSAENIGKRFVVVLDGVAITAPTIRAAILGGVGYIEGGFDSLEEAEALAYRINRQINDGK